MAETITINEFNKRLVDLCVRSGLSGLPRKRRDRHILLKSVALTLDKTAEYTEPEINQKLMDWLRDVGASLRLDYVELRRHLVNEEYLGRAKDGSRYWVAMSSRRQIPFDSDIEASDIRSLIAEARSDVEIRRRRYLNPP
jgi:hypothetical protein